MKIGASYMCRVIHWPIRLFSVRKAKTYTFEPALSVPAHGPDNPLSPSSHVPDICYCVYKPL